MLQEKKCLPHTRGNIIRRSVDFSAETSQARRACENIQNAERERKKKSANQEYYTQQGCPSEIKER